MVGSAVGDATWANGGPFCGHHSGGVHVHQPLVRGFPNLGQTSILTKLSNKAL